MLDLYWHFLHHYFYLKIKYMRSIVILDILLWIKGAPWEYILDWLHVHPKTILTLKANIQYTQNQKWRMIIWDNLTRFSADLEMSKMPKLEWTRTAMPWSLLLSPEGFSVEPYHKYKGQLCLLPHSSEKRGLRSTFLSQKMLQNLPYL